MNRVQEKREALARVLYTIYSEAVGGVAYDGKPLPTWEEFYANPAKQKQSGGWLVMADWLQNMTDPDKELYGVD